MHSSLQKQQRNCCVAPKNPDKLLLEGSFGPLSTRRLSQNEGNSASEVSDRGPQNHAR